MCKEKLHLLLVSVIIGVLLAKALIFSPNVFHPHFISDEIYYVTAAEYFLYKVGLSQKFEPPISGNVTTVNGTIVFNISARSDMTDVNILFSFYDWSNLEHPAFIKILLGIIIYVFKQLPLLRLLVLAVSLCSFAVFSYVFISRYEKIGFLSLALFLLLDWLVFRFMYLAHLDSFMIAFLLLSLSFFLSKRRGTLLFLSLAVASKEIAVIFTFPFALFLYLCRKEKRRAISYIIVPVIALLLSYMLNLIFASPIEIINKIRGMVWVFDPFACKNLCLFSLKEEWGPFILFPFLVWIWLFGVVVKMMEKKEDEWIVPYFLAIIYILCITFISFSRAVYIYYYAPIVCLTAVPFADVFLFCKNFFKALNGRRFSSAF